MSVFSELSQRVSSEHSQRTFSTFPAWFQRVPSTFPARFQRESLMNSSIFSMNSVWIEPRMHRESSLESSPILPLLHSLLSSLLSSLRSSLRSFGIRARFLVNSLRNLVRIWVEIGLDCVQISERALLSTSPLSRIGPSTVLYRLYRTSFLRTFLIGPAPYHATCVPRRYHGA